MLRVGLTGGIGSGKSTAAAVLAGLGAHVVDADALAREVLAPGTPGLAAVERRFGPGVLTADGSLDRAALGRLVFADPEARADLEAVTHPAIRARTAQLVAEVPAGAVLVHDVPLLVEQRMAGEYHLVLVVGASEETRLARLVTLRGMSEEDARARIAAQAGDEERRAAADVWLENEGGVEALGVAVRRLLHERLEPFAANLATGVRSTLPAAVLSPPDPTWPSAAARLLARVRYAVGEVAQTLDHIGSTAVPGLPAKDIVDLQVGVRSLAEADTARFVEAMARAGFPRVEDVTADVGHDGRPWPKRFHGSCDPGRVAHVHVREVGSPGWEFALLFRDWLRAQPGERDEYAATKAGLAARLVSTEEYAAAKEPWFDRAWGRARDWAGASGWGPPEG
ncbi:dephospho-CoA kinase [Phycicoccus endophyticus]|uniref:Dephospho-CoA kinase n=1 Tax=Phycicoccus endophyticus TaxID=1690220 RepID=A0A7G9R4C6_9MICO|nr:dephospho-CoA kinase [Phycicoccus endophyticus]NHI18317.1 dephospho-CoA kinase [Phycicoccus endophyticus]QNN50451.1 dephospho-CoA kinase [Phycicoccus endophyticus]GGL24692.1 dephospho-CoA kinase [Phycicoccus endophyticus]